MLSLSNIRNGQAAASYYEGVDDYYTGDESPSQWWGAGAISLGLTGSVSPDVFASVLNGDLPTSQLLHNAASGRRCGTDATFSAPKSVSMQLLIGADRRILNAHQAAVTKALAYMESRLATCRVTEAGVTKVERTNQLLVARFEHDLSRAYDPQLHTHCVIVNATVRNDGQWRALDNQAIYRNKMLLGALYRAELAHELQTLGYDIRLTHSDGRFELAHIDEQHVKTFSQRSNAIEAYLKEHHGKERFEASAWDKKLIAVITREAKTEVDRAYLKSEWAKLSRESSIDYALPPTTQSLPSYDPATIITQAIKHVSERHSVFSEQSILQASLESAVGSATLREVEQAINQAVQDGILIRSGERFTTLAAQIQEREILNLEIRGRSTLTPIFQGQRDTLDSKMIALSDDQKRATLGILLTKSQVIGIQGRAGVGKTTLLKLAAEQARVAGYDVRGLAPSASAARELVAADISSETISAFEHRHEKAINGRTLLIVDEAGMVSTRQMHNILTTVEASGCRVVLVGDTGQLQSVEAGKPFFQLQNNGMRTARVEHIQRQKNQKLKKAVEMAVSGQVAMSIEILDKNITEIADATDRFAQIADDYVSLPESERHLTRVIAGTRFARNAINQQIREKLNLVGDSQEFVFLDRKDLTSVQVRSILNYEVGDIVIANNNYPSLQLNKGESATVVQRTESSILLETSNGKQVKWQPALAHNFSAYTPIQRTLTTGDMVRITANDYKLGLTNGDIANVLSIDVEKQSLTLRMKDGMQIFLDGKNPIALDYGYCSTVYASQGQTCNQVMIEADSHSLTANENTFYVAISRARYQAKIYTDDREMLPWAMGRELENAAALDLKPTELVL